MESDGSKLDFSDPIFAGELPKKAAKEADLRPSRS